MQRRMAFVQGTVIRSLKPASSISTQKCVAIERNRVNQIKCSLTLSPNQEKLLTAVTLPALGVVAYSEFVLASSGCGLPPGPYGIYGAVEGISYLVLLAFVGLSVYVKATSGKGLPPGPSNLLGAAEGLAYMLLLLGIMDAAFIIYKFGELPSAVPTPGSRCYPVEQLGA